MAGPSVLPYMINDSVCPSDSAERPKHSHEGASEAKEVEPPGSQNGLARWACRRGKVVMVGATLRAHQCAAPCWLLQGQEAACHLLCSS